MLHTATANWTPSGNTGLGQSLQYESSVAMGSDAIAVSSQGETMLVEHQAPAEVAALTTQSSYPASSQSTETGLYTADTAVMAFGLLGAWMMVVGSAMLARHMRVVKTESAQQH